MRKRIFTEGEDNSLLVGYRAGEKIDLIMARLKIGRGPLYRRLKELNEPPREPNKRAHSPHRTRLVVYSQAHPLVKEIFQLARDEWCCMRKLAELANVNPRTLHVWNRGEHDLKLKNLSAVGAVMGYELVWRSIETGKEIKKGLT